MFGELKVKELNTDLKIIVNKTEDGNYEVLEPIDYYREPIFLYRKEDDAFWVKGVFHKVDDEITLKVLRTHICQKWPREKITYKIAK